MTGPRLPGPLLLLSPGTLTERDLAGFEHGLAAAAGAGANSLLLREPGLDERTFLELARRVRRLLDSSRRGWLGVHDRAHLAAAAGADALHVGFRSLSPAELRGWLPGNLSLGLSTHAHDDADRREAWKGADYLFHGPVFATPKAHPLPAIGLEGLARAVLESGRPLWALGGLRAEHAGGVRAAGAAGMAMLSGVLGSADPAAVAREVLTAWGG